MKKFDEDLNINLELYWIGLLFGLTLINCIIIIFVDIKPLNVAAAIICGIAAIMSWIDLRLKIFKEDLLIELKGIEDGNSK